MRAVVGGVIYDTETSTELAMGRIALLGKSGTERLYKSPRLGHLFIASRTEVFGMASKSIRRVNISEALEWCAQHSIVDPDVYRELGVELQEG